MSNIVVSITCCMQIKEVNILKYWKRAAQYCTNTLSIANSLYNWKLFKHSIWTLQALSEQLWAQSGSTVKNVLFNFDSHFLFFSFFCTICRILEAVSAWLQAVWIFLQVLQNISLKCRFFVVIYKTLDRTFQARCETSWTLYDVLHCLKFCK